MLVVVGSNCGECWNNSIKGEGGTLGQMGKDDQKVEDVEEGEISDSASVEEISEDVFNKQEDKLPKDSKAKGDANANANSRVWTMRDLYKYPICRGYTGLYNFAWAQAVQNKPLNEIFVMDVEHDENSKRSSPSSSVASVNSKDDKSTSGNSGKEVDKVLIEDSGDEMDLKAMNLDREEGELEEGEIDLDSEPLEKVAEEAKEGALSSDDVNADSSEVESKKKALEQRVNSIWGVLQGITVTEAAKSFGEVSSRLQNALESLRELVRENSVPTKDTLIQLAFGAVNSVFFTMNRKLGEQNKRNLSRLLSDLKSYDPPIFSPGQIKEIDVMLHSLDSSTTVSNKDMKVVEGMTKKVVGAIAENGVHALASTNNLPLSAESMSSNKPNVLSETSRPGVSSFRSRGILLPLLDLHKDHDADSLPSPTRETAPFFPPQKPLTVGDGMNKSGFVTDKADQVVEATKLHPYETDAVKAVSSYQQKFGRSSFFSNDRLPSPTPSEESGDEGGDVGGEVSSSSAIGNFKTNLPILDQSTVSSSPNTDSTSSIIKGQTVARNVAPVSTGPNPAVKNSAKSRDPRLRFANADASALDLNHRPLHNATKVETVGGISSRKQKSIEEPSLDGPALKRQRNESENSGFFRDMLTMSGKGGWLEDTDIGSQITNGNHTVESADSISRRTDNGESCSSTITGKPNMNAGENDPAPLTSTSTPASLPALLKDIAVNPTMLLNILKLGQQQRLAAEAQQKPTEPVNNTLHHPSSNTILGVLNSVNPSFSNPSVVLPKPAGTLQVPSLVTPTQDESAKIRMKPRDPRRVLHGSTLQRIGSMGPDQFKANESPTASTQGNKDSLNVQKSEGQAEPMPMQSTPVPPPDITKQFTKNLKNIADIMSVSQASTSPIPQNLSNQPVQIKLDRVDMKAAVSNSEDQRTVASSAPEATGMGARSQNAWGDVEHLFEGFDDQQKAAIQRERARRIEEQKKMFAARKLCLVLDLDHTLLNSAKFVEVDPVHEEILRKKEEQDREKPQRHLFRFSHMGMWTKLRPGIWNFLEKASKLYELHLYTMGNKLYATEMAKVLDPTGNLFAGRVISRGDDGDPFDGDERVPKSKDLEGVLGMESAVVIIDDSVRVWPHNKLNLIVVERYTYFPCSRRQFGLLGPSLLEIDHDERPEDGTLASSLGVIERIHQIFFSHQNLDDVDVRNILATEQRKILAGCRIVFSRVFPVGEANPHLHPFWQTAEQFGAVCTNQIDENVTHVVANSLGTDKVNWALSTGRFVVHPGWVEASALLYRRANEHDFAIK